MTIDTFYAFAAAIAAMSLTSERLVAIVKSVFPSWFADGTQSGSTARQESWRQFRVQMVAVMAGWITASFMTDGGFNMMGMVKFSSAPGAPAMPALVIGVLASGGSAFWASVVGYAQATKDLKKGSASRAAGKP